MPPYIDFTILLSLVWLMPAMFRCENHINYHQTLRTIASDFGFLMRNIGYEKTCFDRIQGNFQKHRSEVKQIDGSRLMDDMRQDLITMFGWKRDAVERIANETENLAKKYAYPVKKIQGEVDYHHAKRIYDDREGPPPPPKNDIPYRPLSLSAHPNFEEAKVNLRHSAIHVPINVYEQANELQHDINWTETLTETFTKNLHEDPSLSWQFFCSHKGFLRQYPAAKWRLDSSTKMPDLYDCRMRQWYIQAAASPKDLVVLLDVSGSMTGLRKNIAQNVVFNILDTLTEDDFVLVLQFTNEIKYVSPCFDRLVQATKQNIREIKTQLEGFKTSDIANFTLALIQAFQTLRNFSAQDRGSLCNQAVMLITDGAPETYESVFQKYNPGSEIRVFTYVIGREVTQVQEVYWMACNNRGFYAQVANLAEVREQVQHYIPVMSRPLVLNAQRIFAWTPVYAPVSEIQLTDWIWDERVKEVKMKILKQLQRQCELLKQQQNMIDEEPNLKEDPNGTAYEVADEDLGLTPVVNGGGEPGDDGGDEYLFRMNFRRLNIELEMAQVPEKKKRIPLMITLATPVFNHRKYINITKKILVKNVYKDSPPEEIRIAQLHGVAGIDVPIREIEKTASSYQLGVNGYSFMLTNNGKVLYHPDFRPIFQDMLKPYYTSIDVTELEISNSTTKQRWVDPLIETVRNEMIEGTMGSRRIAIKAHLDHMKRPVSKIQHYFYGKIDQTPFSFAVVLPEPYGAYRFRAQVDIKAETKRENFTRYFNGSNWRVHPDWVYCEGPHRLSGIVPKTPEDAILQFLNFDLVENAFVWKTKNPKKPWRYENATCDKELLQSLLYDAKATYSFEECSEFGFASDSNNDKQQQQRKSIDIVGVFVSTRSGLTRFSTVNGKTTTTTTTTTTRRARRDSNRGHTSDYLRSIDEVYYRRAVDYYYHDSKAFVFSIPFEAGIKAPKFLVTASHAIFVGQGKMSTPVAVVGVQYNYTSFSNTFFQISDQYKVNCRADEIDCLVLDNNGFVIISSETDNHAGLSLSEIDHDLLEDMVRNGIYRKMQFFDYQAICIRITPFSNSSPQTLATVWWSQLARLAAWFTARLFGYLGLFGPHHYMAMDNLDSMDNLDMDMGMDDDCDIKFNKSTPRPCDKEFELYELQRFPANQTHQFSYACETSDCSRTYYVQAIPHTNLVLVALLNTCYCSLNSVRFEPRECILDKNETCELFRKENFRKRPEYCFKQHEQENEIKFCGRATALWHVPMLVIILVALAQHWLWPLLGRC